MKNGRAGILYLARAPKFQVENPTAKAKNNEKTKLMSKNGSIPMALISSNGPTLRRIIKVNTKKKK
jgi:hypothetical protein